MRVFKLRDSLVRPADLDNEKQELGKYAEDGDAKFEEKKKNN